METTHIDRANANQEVYRRANEAMGVDTNVPNFQRKFRPLSAVLYDKRFELLGHITRRPRHHPRHQVTFATNSLEQSTAEGWEDQDESLLGLLEQ